MDIRNCKRCGKVYNYNGSSVCAECNQKEQEDFEKVREYLFQHPNSTTIEVTNATGIDPKVITRLLKEGRLLGNNVQISDDEGLKCEKCGQSIYKGRFCEKCATNLKDDLQKTITSSSGTASASSSQAFRPVANNQWQTGKVHTYEHIIKKKK